MGSGVTRIVTGHFTSAGATKVVNVGFRPKAVMLINSTGPFAFWSDTMPNASMNKQASGTTTFETSLGVTPSATGFTLGADTDINASTETVHWTAWG